VKRRDFLRLSGAAVAGGVAGGALAGCSKAPPSGIGGSSSSSSTPEGTRPPPSGQTSSPPAPPVTEGDWVSFGRSLDGRLVLPGARDYLADVRSYNPVFDNRRPAGVAYVASAGDVTRAIAFGRDHDVALSVRSGGHCYGGWSTGSGLVIDVTDMATVAVAGGADMVSAGAGTRLIDFYAALAEHGVGVPGGSCPTVGLAGLTLGGGLGVTGRKFGLTCDNLQEADVVLSSGEVVTASATSHSDLFWALRGAGAASYGVVTEFRFSTHAVGELGLFTLVWPWAAATRVVEAWQSWAPTAPDELWSNCLLLASQNTPAGVGPAARVTGVYVGGESELEALLQPLLQAIGAAPFTRFVGTAGYLDTMLIEAGCEGDSVSACHLTGQTPQGILTRSPFAAKSDIATAKLPPEGISALLSAVEARQSSAVLSGGGIALDASGGAINRVPPGATAYVHRDALFMMQYSAEWGAGASTSVVASNRRWLQSAWQSMRPFVSGQAYQNYVDPLLSDWAAAYYGANLDRLEEVKSLYDPGDVFNFPQSIPSA
jgi:hypothetical protein